MVFGKESVNLSRLVPVVEETPDFQRLVDHLVQSGGENIAVLPPAARPYVVAALHRRLAKPLLVIVPTSEEAQGFFGQLLAWCDESASPVLFPEPDALPYEQLAPDSFIAQQRVQILARLVRTETDAGASHLPPLVVGPAGAIVRKTMSCRTFVAASHVLTVGMCVDPFELMGKWIDIGYESTGLVEVPGTFGHRGGILDVYPPNSDLPARIEFFGNEVESIRLFDPHTQRSLKALSAVEVIPAREASTNSVDTVMDYLPADSLVIVIEPGNVEASIVELDVQAAQVR